MKKITLTLIFWLIIIRLNGQVFEAVSLGTDLIRQAGDKMERKKKIKLAKRYTQFLTTDNGDIIPMMRVPNNEINSRAENFIIALQEQLKKVHNQYLEKKHIKDFENLTTRLNFIKSSDPDWLSENYQQEIKYYENYEKELDKKEKTERAIAQKIQQRYDDSIQNIRRLETLRQQEEVRIRRDSIIAKIEEQNRQAVYKEGRIKQDSINAIQRIKESKETEIYKPSKEVNNINYESQNDNKTTKQYRSKESVRTYYTGKRGGCYYLSASGSKVYVDRSLCR
jgi:hypothetical protein